jgi:hypothetical protein
MSAKCKWCGTHEFKDPDTGAPVSVDLYKTEGGGVFGVDSSYLEQDVGPVYEPFDGLLTELDDDEDEGE